MCTPNARLGSCAFLRCVAPCVKPENRHCRGESEGGLPSSRTDGGGGVGGLGDFPWGTVRLLVIVPDHFHIPNYFNQAFLHMDSSL